MNGEVTAFIEGLSQPWQQEISNRLRQLVFQVVPDASDRVQYKKPHFLKNGKYAAVISPAKEWVSFTLFNGTDLDAPEGLFEAGPPERRTVKIRQNQVVDYDLLTKLLTQATASL